MAEKRIKLTRRSLEGKRMDQKTVVTTKTGSKNEGSVIPNSS